MTLYKFAFNCHFIFNATELAFQFASVQFGRLVRSLEATLNWDFISVQFSLFL